MHGDAIWHDLQGPLAKTSLRAGLHVEYVVVSGDPPEHVTHQNACICISRNLQGPRAKTRRRAGPYVEYVVLSPDVKIIIHVF